MKQSLLLGCLALVLFGMSPTEAKADTYGYFNEEVDILGTGQWGVHARADADEQLDVAMLEMYWFYTLIYGADEVNFDGSWLHRSSYKEGGVHKHRIQGYIYIEVVWYCDGGGGGGTPPGDGVAP